MEMGLQNPDGGFPAGGKPGNPSCLNNTCYGIGELIKGTGEEARESLRRACEWVLSTQSEEGAFIEPDEQDITPKIRTGRSSDR